MSPGSARAALDRWLAKAGRDATLQRRIGTSDTFLGVTVRAHVTGYKPDLIIAGSGLQVGDSRVVISTTQVDAAEWPSIGGDRVPLRGDRLIVGGRVRIVRQAWEAPRIGGELVRIEMTVE